MKKYLCLFIVIATMLNTSCLKKQNLDEEDLGPAIAPLELTKALAAGFGPFDFNDIKSNEFSSYVLTQKIQDSSITTIEQQDMTIESSTNTVDKLTLDLNVTKIKYSGGQSSQSARKWHKEFLKSEAKSTALAEKVQVSSDVDEPTFMFLVFQSLAFGSCFNQGQYPETCHRLQTSDINFRVPQTAAAQHQCVDPEQCFINAKKVEFDMVRGYQLDQDGKPKRTHYTLILSKEVPFTSKVLKFCSRSLYEISSSQQKILADLCYDINNYAFGN